MTVIPVRCLGRGAEPLLPLKEALAGYLGRTPGQIRRTLARAAPRLLDAVPFIGSFLGAVGEKITEGAEVSRDLKGVYEELSRVLIKAIAGRSGLFLHVDDLHSADPDTLYFLNYLFRKLDQMPVLAVATIQEEQLNDYPQLGDLVAEWTASGYAALTVVPLERAHVGEYVRQRAAMGQDPDETTVDRLFQLTGGNPFFLREALNLITQAPETHAAPLAVPPRTDAILRRRLARADEATQRFMRAASVVLGTSHELAPIAYVMEADTREAIDALNKACELRLMREGPNGEVSFVHSLMQHEVYADMGANQRRYLHGRAGEWFERNGGLATAAAHFEQASQAADMVRAGYAAAAQAERAGMYHTALMLYQKVRPHVSIEELGPHLGNVLVVLGDWDEAERLIELLPVEDSRVRLLRSELAFVRGDFEAAQTEAEMALMASSADRVQVLIRLADIALYLGDFSEAQRYGHAALDAIGEDDNSSVRARCQGIVAATEFFGGDIAAAETRFRNALELVDSAPEADRDRVLRATILANIGGVAEAKHEWARAENLHREALRLRREVADARGAVQSLHAVGRARLGAGDRGEAEQYLSEAEQLAEGLDETLERAKIRQTRADLLLRDGDAQGARELAAAALATFTAARTRYDVTHARVELARIARASGQGREAAEQGARARADVLAMGYGLLSLMYPDTAYDLCERIAGALTAYACGDALGLPWENKPKSQLGRRDRAAARTRRMAARQHHRRHGPDAAGGPASGRTGRRLRCPRLPRGPGRAGARYQGSRADNDGGHRAVPSQRQDRPFRRPGDKRGGDARASDRLGAAPRPGRPASATRDRDIPRDPRRSRRLGRRVRDRHLRVLGARRRRSGSPARSRCGRGPGGCPSGRHGHAACRDADPGLRGNVDGASWRHQPRPVRDGNCGPVVRRRRRPSLRDGLVSAVQLGGDTDTVAALVGGLLGCRLTADQVRAELPWHRFLVLPEPESVITETAVALATTRAVQS